MTTHTRTLVAVILLPVGVCLAGASSTIPPRAESHTEQRNTAAISNAATEVAIIADRIRLGQLTTTAEPPASPVIGVLIDFTASISRYGVVVPTIDDLMPLVELIDDVGGEIGIGSITENPSQPLLRLRLPPPASELSMPDGNTDVFTRRKMMREYREQLPKYEAQERERRTENRKKIDAFITRLETLLKTPPDRQSTDLFGQIRRAETFLMEDPLYWSSTSGRGRPSRHLIIISDGRHTVESSTYDRLDGSVSVAAVSGVGGLGDLKKLGRRVRWFESTASAVYFTITNARRSN